MHPYGKRPEKDVLRDVGNERERTDSRARLFALTGTSVGNECHSKKDSCVDVGKWWYRVPNERRAELLDLTWTDWTAYVCSGKWILPCDECCRFESIDGNPRRREHVTSRKMCALPARGIIWIQHAARRVPFRDARASDDNELLYDQRQYIEAADRLLTAVWYRCFKCWQRIVDDVVIARNVFDVVYELRQKRNLSYLSVDDLFCLQCKHVGKWFVIHSYCREARSSLSYVLYLCSAGDNFFSGHWNSLNWESVESANGTCILKQNYRLTNYKMRWKTRGPGQVPLQSCPSTGAESIN